MTHAGDNTVKLVRMANQIGTFFKSYPEDVAIEGVREHIARFWTIGMRADIIRHAKASGDGLDAIVEKAVLRLKDKQAA